jgi:chloride channel protein, CIC family
LSFFDPERLRRRLPTPGDFRRARQRWYRIVVLAAITGVLVGLAVALFEWVVGKGLLDWTLGLPRGLQWCAPAVGLVLAWCALRFVGHGASPATADEYLDAYHHRDGDLPARDVPGRTLASAATLGFGGAMGFEGPSVYLGAAIGSAVRRRFPRPFTAETRHVLLVAGAAAGVSAIFKAPATGAVFALEVPYQEDSASHTVVPATVAAAASYLTFVLFYGLGRLFPTGPSPPLETRELLGALLVGVLAGIGARGFAWLARASKRVARSAMPVWRRLLLVGVALSGLAALTTLVYDQPLSLGPGYGAIEWTHAAERSLGLVVLLLVIRAAATSLALAGGGVGGVFIPLFVEGWILGTAVEVVVSSNSLLFPVIGAAAFLGAGYRTPIAAVVFVAEVTGGPGFIVPALIATAVAQLLMGRQSITTHQLARRLDPLERALRRPIVDAVTRLPVVPPSARLADVFGDDGAGADRVAVVDDGCFVGIVESVDAGRLLASRHAAVTCADAAQPPPVHGDLGWTVGDAREVLDDSALPALAVVDGDRFLGVVTAASILALDRRLR